MKHRLVIACIVVSLVGGLASQSYAAILHTVNGTLSLSIFSMGSSYQPARNENITIILGNFIDGNFVREYYHHIHSVTDDNGEIHATYSGDNYFTPNACAVFWNGRLAGISDPVVVNGPHSRVYNINAFVGGHRGVFDYEEHNGRETVGNTDTSWGSVKLLFK